MVKYSVVTKPTFTFGSKQLGADPQKVTDCEYLLIAFVNLDYDQSLSLDFNSRGNAMEFCELFRRITNKHSLHMHSDIAKNKTKYTLFISRRIR